MQHFRLTSAAILLSIFLVTYVNGDEHIDTPTLKWNKTTTDMFEKALANVREDLPVGSRIGIPLRCIDDEPDRQIYYTVTKGFYTLIITARTGIVTTRKSLDRDEGYYTDTDNRVIVITCTSYEIGSLTSRSVNLAQTLSIQDINDNAPTFNKVDIPYFVLVNETVKTNTTIFNEILVTDIDSSGSYSEVDAFCFVNKSLSANIQAEQTLSCNTFNVTAILVSNGKYRFEVRTISKVYLSIGQYSMRMKAQDRGGFNNTLSSVATLTINVRDVQTDPPIFVNIPYSFDMKENAPKGNTIEKARPVGFPSSLGAFDGDRDDPNDIMLFLMPNQNSPSDFDFFELGPQTTFGTSPNTTFAPLLVKKGIDREMLKRNPMVLTILAMELGNNNPMNSTQQIEVTIKDDNDYAPKFEKQIYFVRMDELTATVEGTSQLPVIIRVEDLDSDLYNSYRLEISSGNDQGIFKLDKDAGLGLTELIVEVVRKGSLDFEIENNRRSELILLATDKLDSSLTSTTRIVVDLHDINDNPPIFAQKTYAFPIQENSNTSTSVGTISATDKDSGSNGEVTYSLEDQDAFAVNSTTGEIITLKVLDYEEDPEYSLTAYAIDHGQKRLSSGVVVTIIVDNMPDIGPLYDGAYSAELHEGSTELQPNIVLSARVPEEATTIRYMIIELLDVSALRDRFSLDGGSGKLVILDKIDYTETNKGVIKLNVSACTLPVSVNNGLCTYTTVIINVIDLNNFAPEFLPTNLYEAKINETAAGGAFVAQLSTRDRDGAGLNGNVTYRVASGGADNFILSPITGRLSLVENHNLDYDDTKSYTLIILAKDNGTPTKEATATVVINILDQNNKPPIFKSALYLFTEFDTSPINKEVDSVSATDQDTNSNLSYSIDKNSVKYELNSVLGSNIRNTILAMDAFRIDARNGSILINGPIDRTKFTLIKFNVIVEDLNQVRLPNQPLQQASTTVRINILNGADKTPVFPPPWSRSDPNIYLTKQERKPLNWTLYSLSAFDPGNLEIVTIFVEDELSDPEDYFYIRGTQIIVQKQLDFEKLPSDKTLTYRVTAVSASGRTADAIFNILVTDINDNAPIFQQMLYTFYLPEGSQYGKLVGQLRATDADSGSYSELRFSLSGTESEHFILFSPINDPNKAELYVSNATEIDFESIPLYTLSVYARDNPGRPINERQESAVGVQIFVTDINDNYPIFDYPLYTFKPIGTATEEEEVGAVRATDRDRGANGEVVYSVNDLNSLGARYFTVRTINQGNIRIGMIYTKKDLSSLADNTVFDLVIKATDSGANSNTTIARITVTRGVKDPNPKWDLNTRNRPVIEIPEDTKLNVLVIAAKANPQFVNSSINYSFFKTANDLEQDYMSFSFNRITGEIRTNTTFDREIKKSYNLLLLATDGSNTTLTSQLLVTITITDIDDNDPNFQDCPGVPEYEVPVLAYTMEKEPPNRLVYTARACDQDEPPNNRVQYKLFFDGTLCESAIEDYFIVSAISGEIRTKVSLDRETKDQYLVCVKAYEPAGRKKRDIISDVRNQGDHQSILYVLVTVLDANDNGPKFPLGQIVRVILEYPSIQVVASEATDDDLPPNNVIRYSIDDIIFTSRGKSQPAPLAFGINSASGVINVGSNDYTDYVNGRFTITQRAEDKSGANNISDTKIIKVYVAAKSQQIRVVLNRPADGDVEKITQDMMTELNAINSGVFYQVMKISYHIVSNDQDPIFDQTDVCMVIVQEEDIFNSVTGVRFLTDNKKVKDVLDKYGATNPGTCEPARSVYPTGWESYWWVLVAFAIFIFLVTLILIAMVTILYEKLKRYMKSRRTYLVAD